MSLFNRNSVVRSIAPGSSAKDLVTRGKTASRRGSEMYVKTGTNQLNANILIQQVKSMSEDKCWDFVEKSRDLMLSIGKINLKGKGAALATFSDKIIKATAMMQDHYELGYQLPAQSAYAAICMVQYSLRTDSTLIKKVDMFSMSKGGSEDMHALKAYADVIEDDLQRWVLWSKTEKLVGGNVSGPISRDEKVALSRAAAEEIHRSNISHVEVEESVKEQNRAEDIRATLDWGDEVEQAQATAQVKVKAEQIDTDALNSGG